MYKTDKIAILMATYNSEKYIKEQIESILNQSCKEVTLYIHDDGSNDNTMKIIEEYQNKYSEWIVIIDGQPTRSAKSNFFYLLNQVEAPFYMFSDHDDVWLNKKVEITYNKMKEMTRKYLDEKPMLVSTDLKVVDKNLNIISESMREYSKIRMGETITTNKLLIQNYAVGCTLMLNKKLRDMAINSYNDKIIMHDWWLALIANIFGYYENVNEATILYRQHCGNEVGADRINIKYVIKKLGKLRKSKKIIQRTREQVSQLGVYFKNIPEDIVDYGNLNSKNKLYRMLFYIKNRINKQGVFRKIGIIIYC